MSAQRDDWSMWPPAIHQINPPPSAQRPGCILSRQVCRTDRSSGDSEAASSTPNPTHKYLHAWVEGWEREGTVCRIRTRFFFSFLPPQRLCVPPTVQLADPTVPNIASCPENVHFSVKWRFTYGTYSSATSGLAQDSRCCRELLACDAARQQA